MSDAEFFASIREHLFGGSLSQPQVDGITAIRAEWAKDGDGDASKEAYVLATVFHETARTMQPIKEMGGLAYLKAKPYYPYYGRGLVQLSWSYNYKSAGAKLGLGDQLVLNPDLALRPDIAVRVLVRGMLEGWFTGKKLSTYIGGGKSDFKNARRIVNGIDEAALIAGYADIFAIALGMADKAAPAPIPSPTPTKPPASGLWARIVAFFTKQRN